MAVDALTNVQGYVSGLFPPHFLLHQLTVNSWRVELGSSSSLSPAVPGTVSDTANAESSGASQLRHAGSLVPSFLGLVQGHPGPSGKEVCSASPLQLAYDKT